MIKALKKIFVTVRYWIRASVISKLLSILEKRPQDLILCYNPTIHIDGTGAQIQRIITIRELAFKLNCGYVHVPIREVTIHALDGIRDKQDYDHYLRELNEFISFESTRDDFKKNRSISCSELTIRILFSAIFFQILNRKVIIHIGNPYPITEYLKLNYEKTRLALKKNSEEPIAPNPRSMTLILHYRQGVGGHVIYPGQALPRESDIRSLKKTLTGIFEKYPEITKFHVHTDAPAVELKYQPLQEQQVLWSGTPKYTDNMMDISKLDFAELLDGVPKHVKTQIIRGGNPIQAIKEMSRAEILIMARSSLSYVGGLLNDHGVIYFNEKFWHKPLNNWIRYHA